MDKQKNLIWLDLEMTGLIPEVHKIVEIATIVTDSELNILAQGPVIAIYQPEEELAKMNDWVRNQHTQSGLIERIKASRYSEAQAEKETLAFLESYVEKGASPLCGNSIHMDRYFLNRYMPVLIDFCHYRNLDVSTLKELARRWAPDIVAQLTKESKHLALDDVIESIEELKFYRKAILKV